MLRILIVTVLFFLGCDGVKDILDPYDAPVIHGIAAKPGNEVSPGDTVEINVDAENPETGILYYKWNSSTGGRFVLPADQSEVKWVAPLQGGVYRISVEVSNEEKSSNAHVDVVVLSTQKPVVRIDKPSEGDRFVQYTEIEVESNAYHENGIARVWLYVNDQVRDSLDSTTDDHYHFSFAADSVLLGPVELKIVAEAAVMGIRGEDKITVYIDGILPGKVGD